MTTLPRCRPLSLSAVLLLTVIGSANAGTNNNHPACMPLIDAGLALEIKAATAQGEKQAWSDVEKLQAQAEQAWHEAATHCQGAQREHAQANEADAKRARLQAASQVSTPACDQASSNARRMQEFAGEAWTEKRWDDAAKWSRKADLAWDSAIAQCTGNKREDASQKRAAARLDAHNATVCGPLWEKASELSSALKDELPGLNPAQRNARSDQIERHWNDIAATCKGAAAERAQASADSFAKARGTRPLAASEPPDSKTAPGNAGPQRLSSGDITYIGQFAPDTNQVVSGKGRIEWKNGDVFEGSVVGGKAEGPGRFVWQNGQRYEGDFADGLPSGQGKLHYGDSGDQYSGAFVGGLPHGQGTYTWKSGDRYSGGWVNGRKQGQGRYTWANGNYWEGQYADDQRAQSTPIVSLNKP